MVEGGAARRRADARRVAPRSGASGTATGGSGRSRADRGPAGYRSRPPRPRPLPRDTPTSAAHDVRSLREVAGDDVLPELRPHLLEKVAEPADHRVDAKNRMLGLDHVPDRGGDQHAEDPQHDEQQRRHPGHLLGIRPDALTIGRSDSRAQVFGLGYGLRGVRAEALTTRPLPLRGRGARSDPHPTPLPKRRERGPESDQNPLPLRGRGQGEGSASHASRSHPSMIGTSSSRRSIVSSGRTS